MIFRLIHPGSAPKGALEDAAQDYMKRIKRHYRVEEAWVKPSKHPEVDLALEEEAERIRGLLKGRDLLVMLDRTGKPWSSEELAQRLETWMGAGYQSVNFAIGSAHGLSPSLQQTRPLERWSFGPLTLAHDLARVVLWEQVYRAGTILRGEPYHK